MAEAPHGTAPSLFGKNAANPMAMILAGAALLRQAAVRGYAGAERAAAAIYDAVLEATSAGTRTADLGGDATMTGFTDEVIARVRAKLSAA
jgi:isocitrate/isopropylmalate dehydrogenase